MCTHCRRATRSKLMSTHLNRWKIAFVALTIVASCTILFLAARPFGMSAELDMLRDGYSRRDRALAILRRSIPELLQTNRFTQKDIFEKLQRHNQGAQIVVKPSVIELDQMRFCFAPDGALERIEKTDDYGTRASDVPANRPAVPER